MTSFGGQCFGMLKSSLEDFKSRLNSLLIEKISALDRDKFADLIRRDLKNLSVRFRRQRSRHPSMGDRPLLKFSSLSLPQNLNMASHRSIQSLTYLL